MLLVWRPTWTLILAKHALQMVKPALSVELINNDHFSGVCFETGPSQQEQPQRSTQWQTQGRGQGHRTPCGQSQKYLLMNKTYVCCRRQMMNTLRNTTLMTTQATSLKLCEYNLIPSILTL